MYELTWSQAQEAMREGKRVRNSNFTVAEWFAFDGRHIVDEEGYYMDKWYKGYDWQNEGWMVIEDINPDNKQMKVAIIGGDMSSLEYRVNTYFLNSIKEMCRGVEINFKTPEVLVKKQGCFDYTQHKIKKGKGHNKLQKRKKK